MEGDSSPPESLRSKKYEEGQALQLVLPLKSFPNSGI